MIAVWTSRRSQIMFRDGNEVLRATCYVIRATCYVLQLVVPLRLEMDQQNLYKSGIDVLSPSIFSSHQPTVATLNQKSSPLI